MTGLVLAHPLVWRALRHHGPLSCFTASCSSAARRRRSVPVLLCLSSSFPVACAMHVVARTCHVAAAPTVADPAKSGADCRATDTRRASRGASSSTSDNSDEVKPVTTATSFRTASTGAGGAEAALHHRRRRRRRRHRDRSSTSSPRLNAASLPSPPISIAHQLGGATAAADSDAAGPTLSLPISLTHSKRHPRSATAPTSLEAAVSAHFRHGAWAEALALLAAAHPHTSSLGVANELPAAGRTGDVSVAGRCVSLLLWTGREAAAWQVWRWMQAAGTRSPRSAGQPFDAPNTASPRLVLLLALFQHFAGQGDVGRTQDLLLLLEVTWRVSKGGAVVKGNGRSSKGTHPSPLPSPTPYRGNDAQETWMPLVVEWLRCLTADERTTVTAFYHAAAQRVVCAVRGRRPEEAEMVALLLLGLHVYIPAARRQPHFDEVASSSSSSSAIDEQDREVQEEYRRCVRLWEVAADRTTGDETAAVHVREQDDKTAEVTPFRKSARAAFSAASRALEQVHQKSAEREMRREEEPLNRRASSRPMPLAVYRFWSQRLLTVMGLPAASWRDVPRALHLHPSHDTNGSISAASASSSSSSAEWLRRVHRATDSGDWVAALQLCLTEISAQDVAVGLGLPWLQRLRKGLTACEVAARKGSFGNRSSAPWQGAMALWGFAESHAGTHDDLTRERGRVLMLLASATRWAEALRCFHDTPAASLDGFMVAQVCYALRASADRRDRAVLDLWATWRCRVGDSVAPTSEMVVQLLQAMLHTSAPLPPAATDFTAASEGSQEASPYWVESPSVVAAEVATGLLVAAAAAAEAAASTTPPSPSGEAAASSAHIAGSEVPLDWQRHRSLVRQLLTDRWTGGWEEALQVALASADVALVRHVAARVPPTATSLPSSTLFMDVVRRLRCRGVDLTASEQAALWGQWGSEAVTRGEGPRQRRRDDGGGAVVGGTEGEPRLVSAPVWLGSREDVEQLTRDVESLLDELLQRD